MNTPENYYVYCYIDPRNLEEFYYGKGKGGRSLAHLRGQGESDKAARIKQIKAAGVEPIIRIIAADLTEDQAFLIETALIWKLGKRLTNKNSGSYGSKFRPQNTLHRKLAGFDFSGGIYCVNVAEGRWCSWEDCRKFGFLRAGHGRRWSDQIRQLNDGDVVVAYLRKHGYVGVGQITAEAVPVRDFRYGKKLLKTVELDCPNIFENSDDHDLSEYLVGVKWLIVKKREDAIWRSNYGLFTTQHAVASLANQPKTLRYIEKEWDVRFEEILEPREELTKRSTEPPPVT